MTAYPDWVLDFPDPELARRFGQETLERGQRYAAQHVRETNVTGALVTAAVVGSAGREYRTTVVCQAGPASLVATCTCPVRRNCKHAVALIVHMRGALKRASVPSWRAALDPLLARTSPGRGGVPLALQVNDHGYGPTLRPLRIGATGGWVKAGATWDDIRHHGHALNPEQRATLLALLDSRRRTELAYGHRADAVPLGELGPDVWELLVVARDAGVPLRSGEGPGRKPLPEPHLLSVPAEPGMDVIPDGDGVRVAPVLRVADETLVVPADALIGRPAHGLSVEHDGRLLLGPLSRALTREERGLFAGGAVSVPRSDIGLFAAGFLPQLRRRFGVAVSPEVTLPEALPPVLRCDVAFGHRSASVTWGFGYRVDGVEHILGLRSVASEPPVRNPAAEAELAASVPEGDWRTTDPWGNGELIDTDLDARPLIDFVGDVLPSLRARADAEVRVTGEEPEFREAADAPQVRVRVSDSSVGDWFDLGVEVRVGEELVPFAPLFTALAVGDDHLMLDSGTWFSLDIPELQQLRAIIDEARELIDHDGHTFHLRPEHAGLWEELVGLGVVAEQSAAWSASVGALLDLGSLPPVEVPTGLQATLRPYQLEGFRWLTFLWRSRLGGILADEMGLGKTLQALTMAQSALESGELDAPLLVVAPTSVLGTWASEARRFTPELRVVTVGETSKRRGDSLADAIAGAHIVLTSYTLLRLDAEHYHDVTWSGVLLDEAQFVKNQASKVYQVVRRLRARVKIALTGTPLENNLMDLWSLLSIAAPGLFSDPRRFTRVFRKPIEDGDADALARLHRRIRPLILRRTKSAVAAELPDKQEQVIPVELSAAHRALYDRHLAHERQKVLGLVDNLARNRLTILRSLTRLRQLALAPSLVEADWADAGASAKIDTLVEMLTEVMSEGHRALVFSQFTSFLSLVRDRFAAEDIAYEYLDGRTLDRAARIDSFREGDAPVFLISLKAGGFGLTLTEADYVFILDPWWNPAAESQAIDRTHRIGQDKPVNVYRLVSADTIEEKVVSMQDRKRDLFAAVVGQTSTTGTPLSATDIRGLLD